MKNILLILIFAAAPLFAQADSAVYYLDLASKDGSLEHFNRFVQYYSSLSIEQKEEPKTLNMYRPYYRFLTVLFTNPPNVNVYMAYLKTRDIWNNIIEEDDIKLAEYFSYYFANNLPASLDVLDKIPGAYLQVKLFGDACAIGQNEAKIYAHMASNNLTEAAANNSYLKNIKRERYLEVLNRYKNSQTAEPNPSDKRPYVTSDMDILLDTAYACLCYASEDGNIALFNEFAKYYEQLDWDRKSKIIIDDSFLYHFLAVLFTNRPNEEIYTAYLAVEEVLKSSSSSFDMAKYFSYYFANNMPRSLEVLEKMSGPEIVYRIFFDATSKEKNMIKIRDYIETNKLQTKPYYDIIKKCFY